MKPVDYEPKRGDRIEYVGGAAYYNPRKIGCRGTVSDVFGGQVRVSWDGAPGIIGLVDAGNLQRIDPAPEIVVSPDGSTAYVPEPKPEPLLDPARVAALDKAAEVLGLLDVRPVASQVESLASWLLGGRS